MPKIFHEIFKRIPIVCLYALLIFTPLAVGSAPTWAMMVIHIITLIALTAYFIEKIVTWQWHWIRTPIDIPLAIMLIVALLSALFSTNRYTSVWSIGLLLNYIAVFYLTIHSITTRRQLRLLFQTIVYVAVILSIFGLIKKSGANPFPWWEYDIGLNREIAMSSSTYGNPNHFAGYLAMSLPVCVGMFLSGQREFQKILTGLFTILILLGLIFALSRGGWMSAFFGMAVMGGTLLFASKSNIFSKKYLLIMAGSLFFIGLVFLFSTPAVEEVLTLKETSEDASLQSRILVWRNTVKMIEDYPLIGSGPGTYATVFTQYQPPGILGRYYMAHNDYLHFISETGIPLIVVMVWMIAGLYSKGMTKLTHPSRLVRGTTVGALSGISAILFYSIFDFNLHIPANAILFTVLAAIVVSPLPQFDEIHINTSEVSES